MFKKFSSEVSVSSKAPVKSSVQRQMRARIEEQMPSLNEYMDELLPKKEKVLVVKCEEHVSLLCVEKKMEPLFFCVRDGPYFPTLRLLHMFPHALPRVQVDRGAIKHVMKGADIMCPGLTSPGAAMPVELEQNAIVAVMAEGKQHAVGIGRMKMSTAQIREVNKGVGIENVHHLGDGLFKTITLS
ncbi:Malignant T-cell-amplified sequence 1 [Porphyridium purpureum]|uniref:Malignant T-cell-amplified sequence 1 n=1 Tax=Porphyridium purpureum TaxID=35688 RepID=A0A5J4YQ82_PORPP|nr:Malignant T-cell-amplified sequence 1 [Porphyridium purpureum]|eukprot:POR3484..scf296_7